MNKTCEFCGGAKGDVHGSVIGGILVCDYCTAVLIRILGTALHRPRSEVCELLTQDRKPPSIMNPLRWP